MADYIPECGRNFVFYKYIIPFLLQYNDLMKKKRIVENDKSKILATIEDLDQKKNQALNIAWQKVLVSQNVIPSRGWRIT